MQLDDNCFISQFEDLSLDPDFFDHYGHLRVTWLYLKRSDKATALNKTCLGIKAYAESLDAGDKFNWTLSVAMFHIVAKRVQRKQSWSDFLADNQDLVEDAQSILTKHYSQGLLYCEMAKKQVLPPDIKPI